MSESPDLFKTRFFLDEVSRTVLLVLKSRCPSLKFHDGEDIAQDVLIKILRATENGTKIENLRSYIWRAAYTTALDVLAERGKDFIAVEADDKSAIDGLVEDLSTEEVIESRNVRRWIERMIDTLPAARRQVFKLTLLGMTTKDISAHLGWSHSKVRHLYYRGVDDLRRKMRRDEYGRTPMVIDYDGT